MSTCAFWPSDEQPVLVVAAADVEAVRAQLEPLLGGSLCVVRSRWTTAQLDETQQFVVSRFERWGVYGCGRPNDEHGQALITVEMLRVTDQFADWCDGQPAGLVRAAPCLVPASVATRSGQGER